MIRRPGKEKEREDGWVDGSDGGGSGYRAIQRGEPGVF